MTSSSSRPRLGADRVYPGFTGEPDRAAAESAATALYDKTGQPVFLTLGAGGILAFHAEGPTHIPAVPVAGPIDIVGAGDATMAGIASALCAGATVPEAAQIGCLAAAVTIKQIGTTGTASREQMAACYGPWQTIHDLTDFQVGDCKPPTSSAVELEVQRQSAGRWSTKPSGLTT